jgi:hypothetical protein
MRRTLTIGIGASAAALAIATAAGVATAASTTQQASSASVTAASVNKHITAAQARQIARALVPHSRVVQVESDDLHDRAVWKVTLATPHGRVIVDVDKRTGRATIVRRGGSGHGDALAATRLSDDHIRDGRADGRRDNNRLEDQRHHDRNRDDTRHGR